MSPAAPLSPAPGVSTSPGLGLGPRVPRPRPSPETGALGSLLSADGIGPEDDRPSADGKGFISVGGFTALDDAAPKSCRLPLTLESPMEVVAPAALIPFSASSLPGPEAEPEAVC